jgi:K+-sensing histidine kinase KdpD
MMPTDGPAADDAPTGSGSPNAGPTPRAPEGAVRVEYLREPDRRAFLDILSHELRTPVTTIYGGAKLLATGTLDRNQRLALAADVATEAERLHGLVEDLVILARSERDDIRPVGEPVALDRIVVEAIERTVTRHPGVVIRFLGRRDIAADSADEDMLEHVLRDLLDEAVRAGGALGPIEIVVAGSAEEVSVRIVDQGDHEARPDGSLAAMPSGIGVYVADRLIQAMGGRLWTTAAVNGGHEVGFCLDRSPLDPPPH